MHHVLQKLRAAAIQFRKHPEPDVKRLARNARRLADNLHTVDLVLAHLGTHRRACTLHSAGV